MEFTVPEHGEIPLRTESVEEVQLRIQIGASKAAIGTPFEGKVTTEMLPVGSKDTLRFPFTGTIAVTLIDGTEVTRFNLYVVQGTSARYDKSGYGHTYAANPPANDEIRRRTTEALNALAEKNHVGHGQSWIKKALSKLFRLE